MSGAHFLVAYRSRAFWTGLPDVAEPSLDALRPSVLVVGAVCLRGDRRSAVAGDSHHGEGLPALVLNEDDVALEEWREILLENAGEGVAIVDGQRRRASRVHAQVIFEAEHDVAAAVVGEGGAVSG
jgi:hypothetical protein